MSDFEPPISGDLDPTLLPYYFTTVLLYYRTTLLPYFLANALPHVKFHSKSISILQSWFGEEVALKVTIVLFQRWIVY